MLQPTCLKYFEAVARTGSIRHASDTLFVASSAVSRQIVNLEKDLSAELFERTAHGMTLTPAGEVFLRFVQSTNSGIDRIRSEIEDLSALTRGTVRIAAAEGTTFEFLPRMISSFCSQHPGIGFQVSTLGTHQIAEQVVLETFEIGLAFCAPSREDLILRGRIGQSMQVVFRPGHALAGRGTLTMADLQGQALALPDRTFGIRHLVERAARTANVVLDIRHESNSLQLIKSLVRSSDVVSFMPRLTFEKDEAEGLIAAAELNDPVCAQATIDVITARGHKLSAAARSFLRHLIAA
jgi:DNA-binding transcriptional LysR family regulator